MMARVRQSEFARLLGVNRSTVTRWKDDGRLVIVGGLVEVEESRRRLDETSGGRDDMAARHAEERGAPIPSPHDDEENRLAADSSRRATPAQQGIETRANAQARKESLAADILEMEIAVKRANLIPKEDVDAALKAMGAALRSAMDSFPDQIAPLVTPVTDYGENHAQLAEACRNVLASIAEQLQRAEQALVASES